MLKTFQAVVTSKNGKTCLEILYLITKEKRFLNRPSLIPLCKALQKASVTPLVLKSQLRQYVK